MRALPLVPPRPLEEAPVNQRDVSTAHWQAHLQAIAAEMRLLHQLHDQLQARCAALELRCQALLGLGSHFTTRKRLTARMQSADSKSSRSFTRTNQQELLASSCDEVVTSVAAFREQLNRLLV